MTLHRDALIRYSRQLRLPELGLAGQERLAASRVLVVGAGGLGSGCAPYLAASGVGELIIADADTVELSNLHRQLLHTTADVGRPKVDSARARLEQLNPEARITPLAMRLDADTLSGALAGCDAVVDGSDNFATRFAVNAASRALGIPLISAAAIRFEGQLSVFDPRDMASPCYRCLYRDSAEQAETCALNGVLPPIVGALGSLQALETIKVLTGIGRPLVGRLLVFDGLAHEWRTLRLKRDPDCPVCA